jgi:hypothetical protein
VSWKRVVQQRAQTERNWEEGTYRVVHEFSGKATTRGCCCCSCCCCWCLEPR